MQSVQSDFGRDLANAYLDLHPAEAVQLLEGCRISEMVEVLLTEIPRRAAWLMRRLRPDIAAQCLLQIETQPSSNIVEELPPEIAASLLSRLDPELCGRILDSLHEETSKDIRALMAYPPETAGRLMDPEFLTFRPETPVKSVSSRRAMIREKQIQYVYVIDSEGKLAGMIPIQEVFLASPSMPLRSLIRAAAPFVQATAPREEVVETLETHKVTSVPVVDYAGRLIGVIRQDAILQAVQDEALADMQAMVGVSRDERALSSPYFSVRKRLPWLNINLLTAFLAAGVVGIFESTIAQFTALAVLLPVVAGQSGNTGAQALAVTMRGLAVREVRPRHWHKLLMKEGLAGFLNGVAIALVTCLAVFIWSQSPGLCLVIGIAMVCSMTIAGMAGTVIPIILTLLGQDPAQSSSIVLTTVTDIIGFLSFLGLATLLAGLL